MGPRSQDLQRLGGGISQGLEVVFGRAGESYGGAHSENERSSDLWGSRGGKYASFAGKEGIEEANSIHWTDARWALRTERGVPIS